MTNISYNICFKVKVEGLEDRYVSVGDCSANITWNVGEMIRKSTGLEWNNEANNGLCKDIIPKIADGLAELMKHPKIRLGLLRIAQIQTHGFVLIKDFSITNTQMSFSARMMQFIILKHIVESLLN